MCLSAQVSLPWLTVNRGRSCVVKKVFLATCIALIAVPAFAGVTSVVVPEIDALSGLAALAVVGGALTLIWERRRRR